MLQVGSAVTISTHFIHGKDAKMSEDENEKSCSAGKCCFSWRRVARMSAVVMALVVLTGFMLNRYRLLESTQNCAVASTGSGRLGSNSFDLTDATVPQDEILSGGPGKDGIPALSKPRILEAAKAEYLLPDARVIGVSIGDAARAYPIGILNYHEIVNDKLGGQAIVVTFCPLCDSAAVFDRNTPLGIREFGVSGLLYNSNVLMYDRDEKSESLWSQIKTQAVTGPQVRNQLQSLPMELTTWGDWQQRYPHTTVLSDDTDHQRDYTSSPYGNYLDTPRLMFRVKPTSDRLPTKEKILGVWVGKKVRAYPRAVFSKERTRVEDEIDGKPIVIEFNLESDNLRVVEAGEDIEWMYSLWFAWYAMHPETDVYESEGLPSH